MVIVIGLKKPALGAGFKNKVKIWSGRLDSNQRPPRPERGALPGCATARKLPECKNSMSAEPGKIEITMLIFAGRGTG